MPIYLLVIFRGHSLSTPVNDGLTSAACGLEGGGPLRDLPGPDQSVRRLGQVQVSGDPRGLRRRPKLQEASDYLLVPPDHGGQSGGLLRNGVQRGESRNAGRPAVPHNI